MSTAWAKRIRVPLPKCKRGQAPVRIVCSRYVLRPVALLLLLASACSSLVPATVPPQLQHTPGAFVRLSETQFDASFFRLDYPSTWRVVKLNTADNTRLQVVFVAPDQSTVTLTQVDGAKADAYNILTLENGIALAVHIKASQDMAASFPKQAELLVASIRSER